MKKSELGRMFYELEERIVLLKGEVAKTNGCASQLMARIIDLEERVAGLEETEGLDHMVETPAKVETDMITCKCHICGANLEIGANDATPD